MTARSPVFLRNLSTPLLLIGAGLLLVVPVDLFASGVTTRTFTEMFVQMVLVVGLYLFVGNSGVISFGHVGFMCIGAYATAWLTVPPMMKQFTIKGLPEFLAQAQLPFLPSVLLAGLLAAAVAVPVGLVLMRLSGIAASIATFAFLAIVNTVYSNWDAWTAGTSSIVGIPTRTGIWTAWLFAAAAILVAYAYSVSRFGLALRSARDEPVAAAASGVDMVFQRTIAFVASAFLCGIAGALYGHFLGVVNPDAFYLGVTFTSLAMLILGGVGSLSGAVTGVVFVTLLISLFRALEKGVSLGAATYGLPAGSQEIAIGIAMMIVLIRKPAGLVGNREFKWKRSPAKAERRPEPAT